MLKNYFSTPLATALIFGAMFGPAGLAGDTFFLGEWKIASAAVAPWVEPGRTPDASEMRSLVGKTLTLQPKGIAGPPALMCKGPRYRLQDYAADMLFEGAFGEMHRRNQMADPVKIAASLGFRGSSWKVLVTGCGNELEVHFIDRATAMIGLNDYVYTLRKP